MPFFRSHFILACRYAIAILLLSHCTGGTKQKPIDTDGALGIITKTYYKTSSATSADVVVTSEKGSLAVAEHLEKGLVTATRNLSWDSLHFSADQTVLTINSEPGIYEYSPVSVSSIASGSATLPTPKIETFCVGTDLSGFQEIEVALLGTTYSFFGINGGQSSSIGGDTATVKLPNNPTNPNITYQKEGFGSLIINTALSSPKDGASYQSTFQFLDQNPWPALTSFYCHVNNGGCRWRGAFKSPGVYNRCNCE